MIDIINLSVQFTGENLFEDVDLRINKTDRIALVGSNGSGKSTFLKIIVGLEQPETGSILKQNGIKIGYLPQELIKIKGKSLFEEVKSILDNINEIISKEKKLIDELEKENLPELEKENIIHELGRITHLKEETEFYSVDSKIEKILTGLGFEEKDFFRMTDEFSGGWQMRIQLAKILLAENDLILLDEPTNHLDIDSLQWVIEFLKNSKSALVVVSHDKHFINEVTNKTVEVYNRKINFFNGNYQEYLFYKDERDETLRKTAKNQEKKIKQTQDFIERFRYKATKARQVQSRIKQLEKIERIEIEDSESAINIKFPEPPRSGIVPVELKNISKYYDDNKVINDLSLTIERGDKIVLLGPNGAGKTTLSKLIADKTKPTSGEIIYGQNTFISYFAQEVAEELNLEQDVLDFVSDINEDLTIGQLRSILGSFLFTNEDVFKKIKVLSGGEKSRVALAGLLLIKANLIIMDEPTNHLDYSSKLILQKALIDFPGTIIIVSHDIDFVNPIVNKVIELRKERIKIYPGNVEYYLSKRNETVFQSKKEPEKENKKESRKDQKRIEAENRQKRYSATKDIKDKIHDIETKIEELENKKSNLEYDLADKDVFSNPALAREKNREYEETKSMLETLINDWTELSHSLDEIEKNFDMN